MMRIVVFITATFLLITSAQAQSSDTATAHKFIVDLYEKNNYGNYDTSGCKYGGYEIVKLETPLLNECMPGYTFFLTYLLFDYTNYPKVPTIIVYNDKKPEASYVMYSSTFKKPHAPFFKVFNGISAKDAEQQQKLSAEIASLFAMITTDGTFKQLDCFKYQLTDAFEIWSGPSSLRLVNVHYNAARKLLYVDMINGTAGGDVRNGYKRRE